MKTCTHLKLFCLALLAVANAAYAEKADKNKPAIIDSAKVAVNEQTQTVKGTMVITAERVELKIDAEGFQTMSAVGVAGKPAKFKQKREGLDETVEAEGLALVFDGKADTVLFTDQAIVRRLAKGVPQDEVRGAVIKYFNQTEFYEVKGGPTSSDAGGRVRTILAPRSPAAPSATSK
jgi:lipopolysaccharide export system protein LptA